MHLCKQPELEEKKKSDLFILKCGLQREKTSDIEILFIKLEKDTDILVFSFSRQKDLYFFF